ncbi:hypothetical protein BJY01DRAFT_246906 [Aspergillus pseudoustus]|uniref:Granulins domain-containing protein n=1 Tax=Aspergillus pseudoustus TaxID=1810923 RepID=A0ABR4K593_9EURO
MLLYRICLYLSLTTNVLSSEQDILAFNLERLLWSSRTFVTKTCSYDSIPVLSAPSPKPPSTTDTEREQKTHLGYNLCPSDQKRCGNTCISSTHDCCSAKAHCFPGDYCFHHDGERVYWHEELHVHFVEIDDSGSEGDEVAVVTEWGIESSMIRTATRVTVSASYPGEGRSAFSSVSRQIVRGAGTKLMLDEVPTRTRVVIKDVRRTPMVDDTRILDKLNEGEKVVVLD